jgi:hypothetical protein
MSGRLESEFAEWLGRVCQVETPPTSVVAYNIGLFLTETGYSAYLVGASRFDEDDGDWACEEAFTPAERYFPIPSEGFQTWEDVLSAVVAATRSFLNSPLAENSFLASAEAVTVGFDDGDLERVK